MQSVLLMPIKVLTVSWLQNCKATNATRIPPKLTNTTGLAILKKFCPLLYNGMFTVYPRLNAPGGQTYNGMFIVYLHFNAPGGQTYNGMFTVYLHFNAPGAKHITTKNAITMPGIYIFASCKASKYGI